MITQVNPFQVLIDIGPVQMSITAEKKGKPLGREWRNLEKEVERLLEDLKRNLSYAQKPYTDIKETTSFPKILDRMYSAVSSTGEGSLTPMAAVAGTMAELVSEYLVKRGATKALVNNGGDIAIYLGRGETTKVGIIPRLGAEPSHYIELKNAQGIQGIATSGRGGRSFTMGIADAAVAIASRASVADACATLLGNKVNVESNLIERKLAYELDPGTDIPDKLITSNVRALPENLVEEALTNGIKTAQQLVEKKILAGAVLFLNGAMRQYPENIVKLLS